MISGRKTDSIQVRVTPAIKRASERIMWRLGLRMSDSVEMFLRQVIVDEQLPFLVRAPSEAKLAAIGEVWKDEAATTSKRGKAAGTGVGRTGSISRKGR